MTGPQSRTALQLCRLCTLTVSVSAARAAVGITLASLSATTWWVDRLSRQLAELTAPPTVPPADPGAEAHGAVVMPLTPAWPGKRA